MIASLILFAAFAQVSCTYPAIDGTVIAACGKPLDAYKNIGKVSDAVAYIAWPDSVIEPIKNNLPHNTCRKMPDGTEACTAVLFMTCPAYRAGVDPSGESVEGCIDNDTLINEKPTEKTKSRGFSICTGGCMTGITTEGVPDKSDKEPILLNGGPGGADHRSIWIDAPDIQGSVLDTKKLGCLAYSSCSFHKVTLPLEDRISAFEEINAELVRSQKSQIAQEGSLIDIVTALAKKVQELEDELSTPKKHTRVDEFGTTFSLECPLHRTAVQRDGKWVCERRIEPDVTCVIAEGKDGGTCFIRKEPKK